MYVTTSAKQRNSPLLGSPEMILKNRTNCCHWELIAWDQAWILGQGGGGGGGGGGGIATAYANGHISTILDKQVTLFDFHTLMLRRRSTEGRSVSFIVAKVLNMHIYFIKHVHYIMPPPPPLPFQSEYASYAYDMSLFAHNFGFKKKKLLNILWIVNRFCT